MADTIRISATLKQIYGENLNKKYPLKSEKVLIGRAFTSDIRLQNCNVSRKHCTLTYTVKGWTVQDNFSQNGTWICGQKLNPNKAQLLQCGDIIFLGPPSEMPQAFCFEVNYDSEDEILPNVLDSQTQIGSSSANGNQELSENKDHLQSSCEGVDLPVQAPTPETSIIESDNSVIVFSPDKSSPNPAPVKKEVLESHNSLIELSPVKSSPSVSFKIEAIPKIKYALEMPSSSTSTNKRKFLMQSPQISSTPIDKLKKMCKLQCMTPKPEVVVPDEDSKAHLGDQICEISSSAMDQDSQSLLGDKKSDVANLSSQSTDKETLKEQLAFMSARIKRLKYEKAHYLQKYQRIYNEKKKHVAVQKNLKEDLQNCEQKVKKELLEKFEEDLICNICTELLIKPTVLECTHTFCEFCINEWKKKKNECPICRHKMSLMTRVLTLENFIDKALQTLTPEQKEKREELIKERAVAEKRQAKDKSTTPRTRRLRRRRNVAVPSRRPPAGNPGRQPIELSQRRLPILPLQLPPMPPLFFHNYRIPEVLVSDSELDTINIILS